MHWLHKLAERLYGLDTRSMAVFRVLFGGIVCLDVLGRLPDLVVHYADSGAIPRDALLDNYTREGWISLHMASGSPWFQLFLFAVQFAAGVCMLAGYRTRLATFIAWFLTISLHIRNPLVLQSGDVIIRLMLFWSLFLPLASRFSLDARRAPLPPPAPRTFVGIGGLGFIAQIAFVYLFTGLLKTGRAWHDGTAVYYTMQIDHFIKQPQGSMMLEYPEVMSLLTYATMYWELWAPAALLIPLFHGPLRTFLVFGFIGLHLGFYSFMELGLFPWTCIVVWLCVLPGWFWDKVGWRIDDEGPPIRAPWWQHGLALFFLGLVINWNMSTLSGTKYPVPSEVRWMARTLRLDQKWEMFAPYPMKDDGWFVVPGKTSSGEEYELFLGGEVSWEKPHEVSSMYPSQRWNKYMRNLWNKRWKPFRLYYGKYRCREWNRGKRKGDPDALESFTMYFMKELTPPPGEPMPEIDKIDIWNHNCWSSSKSKK